MLLVTGSGGKTGRAVVRQAAARGQSVRAWVRRPDKGVEGASELFVGDMTVPTDWERALKEVESLYLICPNMHPAELAIGRLAMAAAAEAGVSRFVYHSVLHPQTEEMPHHWAKLRVEEMIVGGGLPFVILQPTAYMQNLRQQLPAVQEEGVLRLPYPPESQISLVDLEDVAAAAVRALLDDDVVGGIYELCGTWPLSQHEVANVFAAQLGRPVEAQELPLESWEAQAAELPAFARETLKKMFRSYARSGLIGNPLVLTTLLGRAPTGLPDVIGSWLG